MVSFGLHRFFYTTSRYSTQTTIGQANAVRQDFLPRYNAQFAVPSELPELAYRPWVSPQPLDEVLASSTPARWPETTRSSTSGAPCSYYPARNVPATPASRWRSWNTPTAASGCAMRARSSPVGQRHRDAVRCALLTALWLPVPKSSTQQGPEAITASTCQSLRLTFSLSI